MQDIRVIYMGTPDFSLKPLEALYESTNVVLVVTKKDAEVGRKKVLTPSPVKKWAIEHNIPVLTPDSLKKEYQSILDYKPDLIVTCAYGKILPKEILIYPKYKQCCREPLPFTILAEVIKHFLILFHILILFFP